jgi:hypothetical protein
MPEQPRNQLSAAAHTALDEEVAHVELHGLLGDEEFLSDLGVREPLGAAERDLRLATAEVVTVDDPLKCGRVADAVSVAPVLLRVRLKASQASALEDLLRGVDQIETPRPVLPAAAVFVVSGALAVDAELRDEPGAGATERGVAAEAGQLKQLAQAEAPDARGVLAARGCAKRLVEHVLHGRMAERQKGNRPLGGGAFHRVSARSRPGLGRVGSEPLRRRTGRCA